MGGSREIRTKIKSTKSTQKITRAMEMVSASKMRKVQDRMAKSRPYATHILKMIGHLAKSHPEYRHVYFEQRDPKAVGFIIVSTDRGLCGGLNVNLFKSTIKAMHSWHDANARIDLCLLGNKAQSFFKRLKVNIVANHSHIGDKPNADDVVGVVKVMLEDYESGKIDKLFLCHNVFVNTMSQQPCVKQLLPLKPSDESELDHYWDYIYEPDAKELLQLILNRYIESQVYQAVVENTACEQASRMVAMKSATDNASELIQELQLVYNKSRQAAITQEISEIVGGAEAV